MGYFLNETIQECCNGVILVHLATPRTLQLPSTCPAGSGWMVLEQTNKPVKGSTEVIKPTSQGKINTCDVPIPHKALKMISPVHLDISLGYILSQNYIGKCTCLNIV